MAQLPKLSSGAALIMHPMKKECSPSIWFKVLQDETLHSLVLSVITRAIRVNGWVFWCWSVWHGRLSSTGTCTACGLRIVQANYRESVDWGASRICCLSSWRVFRLWLLGPYALQDFLPQPNDKSHSKLWVHDNQPSPPPPPTYKCWSTLQIDYLILYVIGML